MTVEENLALLRPDGFLRVIQRNGQRVLQQRYVLPGHYATFPSFKYPKGGLVVCRFEDVTLETAHLSEEV